VSVVVVFTRGMSLRLWARHGILERELALYRALARTGLRVTFLTYGDRREMAVAEFPVLTNGWGFSANLYSVLAPLLHRRALRGAAVLKTNQLNGAWTGAIARRLFGTPLVVRCGFLWSANVARETKSRVRVALTRRVERWVCRAADAIVVPTAPIARHVVEEYGVDETRVTVSPNYVDTDVFRPWPDARRVPGRVVTVGRLSAEKNTGLLIDAVSEAHGLSLSIAGDGECRAALEAQARARRTNVSFLGTVPNNDVPRLVNEAEIFALTSRYEAAPKALVEAMACGAAVVGTDVPGIRDVIDDGRTGLLCAPHPEAVANTLTALAADPERRQRLGAAARAWAERHCALSAIIERERAVLTRVASARA
jgi:glycosyltransferase involved in cell wall biosynthesis